MRLCVPIPCFFCGMDLPAGIRKVRELGFDAAETYEWRGQDLEAVKNACEETGVELLSMCTTEFRMTDPTFRKEWLAGLRESCQAAKKAGVKRLITQVGPEVRSAAREHCSGAAGSTAHSGGQRGHGDDRAAEHAGESPGVLSLVLGGGV